MKYYGGSEPGVGPGQSWEGWAGAVAQWHLEPCVAAAGVRATLLQRELYMHERKCPLASWLASLLLPPLLVILQIDTETKYLPFASKDLDLSFWFCHFPLGHGGEISEEESGKDY